MSIFLSITLSLTTLPTTHSYTGLQIIIVGLERDHFTYTTLHHPTPSLPHTTSSLINPTPAPIDPTHAYTGLQVSIVGLERALLTYTNDPKDEPFDLKSVPVCAEPLEKQKTNLRLYILI